MSVTQSAIHPAHGTAGASRQSTRALLALCLGALGVVFGDIGTSPLYTMSEIFYGQGQVALTPEHVLGATSLVLWSITLAVSVKYIGYVVRADHEGEGGAFALLALLNGGNRGFMRWVGLALILASGLLYGDGIITPAISVLSAVEGMKVAMPSLESSVVPVTVVILLGIFGVQRQGTGKVGAFFGPVVLLWFAVLGVLGLNSVIENPGILQALNPWYAVKLLASGNFMATLYAMGAALLSVTGCEALYADLGHFGRRAIRLSWMTVAYPGLAFSYLGQGAWLYAGKPVVEHQVFYSTVPESLLIPTVLLATGATIIASQALISGAFSVTKQAIALGLFPRLAIVHTSGSNMGQIYVPALNAALCVGCVLLVVTYKSSTALAAAYGFAVCGVMAITSVGVGLVAIKKWGWKPWRAALLFGAFLAFDVFLWVASSLKFFEGGWVPFLIGISLFGVMTTWRWGRAHISQGLANVTEESPTIAELVDIKKAGHNLQAPRSVVVMTSKPIVDPEDRVPAVLHTFRERFGITPRHVIFFTVVQERLPKVRREQRWEATTFLRDPTAGSIVSLRVHYGYMETPNIRRSLIRAKEHHQVRVPGDPRRWLVLVGQEHIISGHQPLYRRARMAMFRAMMRNSVPAHLYFGLGSDTGVIAETIYIRMAETVASLKEAARSVAAPTPSTDTGAHGSTES